MSPGDEASEAEATLLARRVADEAVKAGATLRAARLSDKAIAVGLRVIADAAEEGKPIDSIECAVICREAALRLGTNHRRANQ